LNNPVLSSLDVELEKMNAVDAVIRAELIDGCKAAAYTPNGFQKAVAPDLCGQIVRVQQ